MSPSKLTPNDPRAERKTATVRGKTYAYLHAKPSAEPSTPKVPLILIHGFPDTSFTWRNQIPLLQSQGYDIIAPDMLGYGGTTCPPLDDESSWSVKSMADDIAALCADVWGEGVRVVLCGHDWGGIVAWRVALWRPDLLRGVISICTPYFPPREANVDLETIVRSGRAPTLGYQLQFKSGEVEKLVEERAVRGGEEERRKAIWGVVFAVLGARTQDGEAESAFSPSEGILLDKTPRLGVPKLLTAEEAEAHIDAFVNGEGGIAGPLRWYSMRDTIFREELPLAQKEDGSRIKTPALFIQALRDPVLVPGMAKNMGHFFADLTTVEVDGGHWAMWDSADAVNASITKWIDDKFGGEGDSRSML